MVQRAQEILNNIERGEFTPTGEPSIAVSLARTEEESFAAKEEALHKLLKEVDPDSLSPRQAQELIYELVEEVMRRC